MVAYDGGTAMGAAKPTGPDGLATFVLPMGAYHFTATADGVSASTSQENLCQMGDCEEAVIALLRFPSLRCTSDEACTTAAGPGRRLHVVATDVGGGNLFHAFRESNSPNFLTGFGDILAQTGRPWQALDRETRIVDVAAQSRGNELLVMVLIRSTPTCTPLDPDCNEDLPGHAGPAQYSLWSTVRHPGSWNAFTEVSLGNMSFRSISLSGVGRDYTTFCGIRLWR